MRHRLASAALASAFAITVATSQFLAPAAHADTPTGYFVISNDVASLNATVEFWGSQWSQNDALGTTPAAFKGFTDTVDNASCPTAWSTDTGNSAPPPESVPSQITVIVASSITQSGSTISGKVVELAVLDTQPGYEGNPGHPGWGTIVSLTSCGGGGGLPQ